MISRLRWLTLHIALLALLILRAGAALSHEGHQAAPSGASGSAVRVRLAEVPLLTQEGRSYRFADTVQSGKLMVIGFFYTSCTSYCPLTSALMERIHARSSQLPAPTAQIISITVDPERDTPARLAAQARLFKGGADWIWLTGSRNNISAALRGLGAFTPNFEDHPAMLLVGDPRRGKWIRLNGLPDPELVMAQLGQLIKDQQGN